MKFSSKYIFYFLLMLAVILAGLRTNPARASQMATPATWNEVSPIPLNGNVTSIAVNGTDIYVAGNFTNAGNVADADYIAKWNGTAWSALGQSDNGLNDTIWDMATLGSDLYIVGTFTSVNGIAAKGIAKWNGTTWSAVGSGIGGGEIRAITVKGSDIYVAGFFSYMGGVPAAGVAKWDGSTWSGFGSGIGYSVYDIEVDGTNIYAVGDFTNAGGNPIADFIARWDGDSWETVGLPSMGFYDNVVLFGSDLYVSGFVLGETSVRILKWTFPIWSYISPALTETPNTTGPQVRQFLVSGSDLIVAGHFLNAGGNANADYLAKWNGTTWSAFDASPLNGDVNTIAVSGDDLYVGGAFTDAGGNSSADYLVRYGVPPTFTDVPTYYWAWNYIERLAAAGITGGCGNGLYCPTNSVTRAQMAVFLLKGIHGSSYAPPVAGSPTGFDDVPTDHWAAAWIKQLAAEAITSGCGNGNYCPEDSVTRAQMAVFLLKAKYGSSYAPPNVTATFSDTSGHWAEDWIEQLASEGITSGCSSGVYCPENPVTRDQMAVFLVKAFNLP